MIFAASAALDGATLIPVPSINLSSSSRANALVIPAPGALAQEWEVRTIDGKGFEVENGQVLRTNYYNNYRLYNFVHSGGMN